MRLTLVGAGISALFLSFSQFLAIQFNLSQELTFWFLGGVSVISWAQLKIVVPIFLGAFALAILISPSVTILRFGDDANNWFGAKSAAYSVVCQYNDFAFIRIVCGASWLGQFCWFGGASCDANSFWRKLPALDSVLGVRWCAPRFGGRFNRSNGESAF